MKLSVSTALAAMLMLGAGRGVAGDGVGLEIESEGRVSLVCTLDFEAGIVSPQSAGTVDLGLVSEFCNAGNGYRVLMSFDPDQLAGARAELGGEAVRLGQSGLAILSRSPTANVRQRPLSLSLDRALESPVSIALRIEASI